MMNLKKLAARKGHTLERTKDMPFRKWRIVRDRGDVLLRTDEDVIQFLNGKKRGAPATGQKRRFSFRADNALANLIFENAKRDGKNLNDTIVEILSKGVENGKIMP
jgi:hypothetical protein